MTYQIDAMEAARGESYGHGSLTFGDAGNSLRSHARIVRAGRRPRYQFWASDATQAYQLENPDVGSVTRTILSFPKAPPRIVELG